VLNHRLCPESFIQPPIQTLRKIDLFRIFDKPNNAVQLLFYPQLSLSSLITISDCLHVDNNVDTLTTSLIANYKK
jgi:hypothetical protein